MSFSYGQKKSNSQQSSKDSIWDKQTPYLQEMYGGAQDLYRSQDPNTAQANQLMSQYAGSGQLSDVVGGAQSALQKQFDPSSNQYSQYAQNLGMAGGAGIQSAMNTMGGQGNQQADFSGFGAGNPQLDAAVQAAQRSSNRNFNENIMSGITDQAVSSGQSGSSRQGVAEAIAAREAGQRGSDIAASMYGDAYSQDMARGLQAQQSQAQQAQAQGALGEQQRQYNAGMSLDASRAGADIYGQSYGQNQAAMQNAISQAGTVANLGMVPSNIYGQAGNQGWDQLSRYNQAIGAPTKLGSSQGTSKNREYNASGSAFGA